MPYTVDILQFPPNNPPERLAFEYPSIAEARKAGEQEIAKLMATKINASYEVRDHNGVLVERPGQGGTA